MNNLTLEEQLQELRAELSDAQSELKALMLKEQELVSELEAVQKCKHNLGGHLNRLKTKVDTIEAAIQCNRLPDPVWADNLLRCNIWKIQKVTPKRIYLLCNDETAAYLFSRETGKPIADYSFPPLNVAATISAWEAHQQQKSEVTK